MNLIEKIFNNGNRGMRKYIALALCAIIISTGNLGIISLANTIEQNSPTNTVDSQTEILTYDNKTSNIYLNGEEIEYIDNSEKVDKAISNTDTSKVDTSWRLTNGPIHTRVSWTKGVTIAIVVGTIGAIIYVKTSSIMAAIGTIELTTIAASRIGGIVYFSSYYRDLAFGEVQYKTDWTFVASTGDRYGTYSYYSLPQPF